MKKSRNRGKKKIQAAMIKYFGRTDIRRINHWDFTANGNSGAV